jgi:hypothetical protein
MYIRNYKGKLILFDEKKFINDKEMYKHLWKIKYNKIIPENKCTLNERIIEYISGENNII